MDWHVTIDTPEWKNALTFYVDLMKAYGPPGATSSGFNENLTIFATGKAAMWIDATSGADPLFKPKDSQVSDKVLLFNAQTKKVITAGQAPPPQILLMMLQHLTTEPDR